MIEFLGRVNRTLKACYAAGSAAVAMLTAFGYATKAHITLAEWALTVAGAIGTFGATYGVTNAPPKPKP